MICHCSSGGNLRYKAFGLDLYRRSSSSNLESVSCEIQILQAESRICKANQLWGPLKAPGGNTRLVGVEHIVLQFLYGMDK